MNTAERNTTENTHDCIIITIRDTKNGLEYMTTNPVHIRGGGVGVGVGKRRRAKEKKEKKTHSFSKKKEEEKPKTAHPVPKEPDFPSQSQRSQRPNLKMSDPKDSKARSHISHVSQNS